MGPLVGRRPAVRIDEGGILRVKVGVLGRVSVPLADVVRVGTMSWPWWGGLGARIARETTAFVLAPGRAVLLELREPVRAYVPLPWRSRRVALAVEDIDALMATVAELSGVSPEPLDG